MSHASSTYRRQQATTLPFDPTPPGHGRRESLKCKSSIENTSTLTLRKPSIASVLSHHSPASLLLSTPSSLPLTLGRPPPPQVYLITDCRTPRGAAAIHQITPNSFATPHHSNTAYHSPTPTTILTDPHPYSTRSV